MKFCSCTESFTCNGVCTRCGRPVPDPRDIPLGPMSKEAKEILGIHETSGKDSANG